jgi:hypothetical protein
MIELAKALAIIDAHRGRILKERRQFTKGTDNYTSLSRRLDLCNSLKRELSDLLDTDERPLGL